MIFDFDQVITHGGVFSISDVFGVGLCRLINPDIKIIRTNNADEALERAQNIGDRAIIFNARTDGNSYSGFEQLWHNYGNLICPDEKTKTRITRTFVHQMEKQNLLTSAIEKMNNTPDSEESNSVAFHRAMNVAMILLSAQIRS